MQPTSNKISAYFLSHSPLLPIQQTEYTALLDKLAPNKPKAVIIFNAHWETDITTISSIRGTYDTIYDFSGFPEELYQVKYPAKGSVELASKIKELLKKNGINSNIDEKRGLDHGSWTLLKRIFPKADVPIVQMSVSPDMDPKDQFAIGKALKDLDEEILIIGSGNTVHNFGKVERSATKPAKWAVTFDDWLIETVQKKDYNALQNYKKLAPYADDAVDGGDHFAPFLMAAGCSDPDFEAKVLSRGYMFGSISFIAIRFA